MISFEQIYGDLNNDSISMNKVIEPDCRIPLKNIEPDGNNHSEAKTFNLLYLIPIVAGAIAIVGGIIFLIAKQRKRILKLERDKILTSEIISEFG